MKTIDKYNIIGLILFILTIGLIVYSGTSDWNGSTIINKTELYKVENDKITLSIKRLGIYVVGITVKFDDKDIESYNIFYSKGSYGHIKTKIISNGDEINGRDILKCGKNISINPQGFPDFKRKDIKIDLLDIFSLTYYGNNKDVSGYEVIPFEKITLNSKYGNKDYIIVKELCDNYYYLYGKKICLLPQNTINVIQDKYNSSVKKSKKINNDLQMIWVVWVIILIIFFLVRFTHVYNIEEKQKEEQEEKRLKSLKNLHKTTQKTLLVGNAQLTWTQNQTRQLLTGALLYAQQKKYTLSVYCTNISDKVITATEFEVKTLNAFNEVISSFTVSSRNNMVFGVQNECSWDLSGSIDIQNTIISVKRIMFSDGTTSNK